QYVPIEWPVCRLTRRKASRTGLLTVRATGPARSSGPSLRNCSLSPATSGDPGHTIPFASRCSDSAGEGTTKNSGTGTPSRASRASVAAFAPTKPRAAVHDSCRSSTPRLTAPSYCRPALAQAGVWILECQIAAAPSRDRHLSEAPATPVKERRVLAVQGAEVSERSGNRQTDPVVADRDGAGGLLFEERLVGRCRLGRGPARGCRASGPEPARDPEGAP